MEGEKRYSADAALLYSRFLTEGKLLVRLSIDYGSGDDKGRAEVIGLQENIGGSNILTRAKFWSNVTRKGQLYLLPCEIAFSLHTYQNLIPEFNEIVDDWKVCGCPIVVGESDEKRCLWTRPEQFVGCVRFLPEPSNHAVLLPPSHPHISPHLYMYAGILAGQMPYEQERLMEVKDAFRERKLAALERFVRRFSSFIGQEHRDNNGWLHQGERLIATGTKEKRS